jgi:hypothetical protein
MSKPIHTARLTLLALAGILSAGLAAAQTAPAPAPAPAPAVEPYHHPHHREAQRARLMQFMDTDRDGQISREEMQSAHARMGERQMSAFDGADANKDGKLSADEMKAFRQAMAPHQGGPGHPGPRGPRGNPPASAPSQPGG